MTWRRWNQRDVKSDVSIVAPGEPIHGGFRAHLCGDCIGALRPEGGAADCDRIVREGSAAYHLADPGRHMTSIYRLTLCARYFTDEREHSS